MINLKEIFKNIRKTKLGLAPTESEPVENASVLRKAQERRWLYTCLIICGVLGIAMKLQGGNSKKIKDEENVSAKGYNIITSYDAMDGNKIWQNNFEDKLRNSQYELQEKVEKVEKVIHDMRAMEEEQRKHRDQEMQKMAEQLKFAQDELRSAALELKRVSDIAESNKYEQEAVIRSGEVSSRLVL